MPEFAGPILEFRSVNLRYEDTWALRNVSFSMNSGDTRIILGAAGSGKTTLLKAAIGLVRVDSGEITLFHDQVTALLEQQLFRIRSRVGVVFQEGGLFDSLSVRENVEYPLLNAQISDGKARQIPEAELDQRVREALRFVELEKVIDKYPSEISGGMRRRVGIARAVVTEPPVVFYDSPTAGLDPITANTIMALIAKERDVRHSTALIVTHRFQDGELMADFRYETQRRELVRIPEEDNPNRGRTKFMVMRQGQVVFIGTLAELKASEDGYVKRFTHEE